jgi:hypothetical protein
MMPARGASDCRRFDHSCPPWLGSLPDAESLECLDVYRALLAALRQSSIHNHSGHALYTVLPGFRLGRLGLHIVDLHTVRFAITGLLMEYSRWLRHPHNSLPDGAQAKGSRQTPRA